MNPKPLVLITPVTAEIQIHVRIVVRFSRDQAWNSKNSRVCIEFHKPDPASITVDLYYIFPGEIPIKAVSFHRGWQSVGDIPMRLCRQPDNNQKISQRFHLVFIFDLTILIHQKIVDPSTKFVFISCVISWEDYLFPFFNLFNAWLFTPVNSSWLAFFCICCVSFGYNDR